MNVPEPDINYLAADAAVTAGLLDNGAAIALLSIVILQTAVLLWLLGYPVYQPALIAAITMAIVQGYFALRVRFDAAIFRNWASRWHEGVDSARDLAAFDIRIGRQGTATTSVEADLACRRGGAMQLLRLQIVCVILQLILTAIALMS